MRRVALMTGAAEAVAVRRAVLDVLEEGKVALAIWLARAHAEELEIAAGVASLVAEQSVQLRYTCHGLAQLPSQPSFDNSAAELAAGDAFREAVARGGFVHAPPGVYRFRETLSYPALQRFTRAAQDLAAAKEPRS